MKDNRKTEEKKITPTVYASPWYMCSKCWEGWNEEENEAKGCPKLSPCCGDWIFVKRQIIVNPEWVELHNKEVDEKRAREDEK